jgi:hypothetical protein
VLKGVVLRLGEDVEAQDALQKWGVAEADDTVLLGGKLEADRDQPTFGVSAARVKRRRFDLLLSESVD